MALGGVLVASGVIIAASGDESGRKVGITVAAFGGGLAVAGVGELVLLRSDHEAMRDDLARQIGRGETAGSVVRRLELDWAKRADAERGARTAGLVAAGVMGVIALGGGMALAASADDQDRVVDIESLWLPMTVLGVLGGTVLGVGLSSAMSPVAFSREVYLRATGRPSSPWVPGREARGLAINPTALLVPGRVVGGFVGRF